MTSEELKTYLYDMGISPENVGFICGYFSDKPEHWIKIFVLRSQGKTYKEIAKEMDVGKSRIGQIIISIKNIIPAICGK